MGLPRDYVGPASERERFLRDGEAPAVESVRGQILSSWQRCRLLGLSPDQSGLPYRGDIDVDGPLVRAAAPVLNRLRARFGGSPVNISLADEDGTVLQRRFGDASSARKLSEIQSVPGFVFAERFAGTNGIGLALAERRLIRVYGAEHFAERAQTNACSAIPIRDPLNGRIEGILCFGYPRSDADPALDTVISEAAQAIERRLFAQSSARERALLERYLEVGRPGRSAYARGDGQLIGLDELDRAGLDHRDRTILRERAAELISAGQRAAVEVSLPGGRRVTLVSRLVTTSGGTEGVIVEAVVPDGPPHQTLALPHHSGDLAGAPTPGPPTPEPAPGPGALGPEAPRAALLAQPTRPGLAEPGSGLTAPLTPDAFEGAGELLLVGEPGVGRYAVAARRRLELLSEASARIGTTLDVSRTAWELAEMAVPQLADFVTIDLPEAVLLGEEADPLTGLHRTVVHGVRDDCPFRPVGQRVDVLPATPEMRCLASREAVLEPDLKSATGWSAHDPEHARHLLDHHLHSLITVPLVARGLVLGIACFYRSRDPAPFGDDDRSLAQELATRAAICIDNARRYTREHTMVLALQTSLLPHGMPEQSAVEVAHHYQPAEFGVGGDWFDVIPLSGARVALVVGDVVGHGIHAAATMGRLRTAGRNFAEFDLPPDEVLTRLDNLVARLDREAGDDTGIIGTTCIYAIYDPTTQRCAIARAGHPPPAVVLPDGTVTIADLPAGPPLGLGGLPFETAELHLPEGSQLVLYTDGLIESRDRDTDVALDELRRALAQPDRTPEETCRSVLDAVAPEHPCDDIALLVARTRALGQDRVATWELPCDPARVSALRARVTSTLGGWGLEESAFTAELLLSELVTNAIRYGSGPIQVRVILDRTLIFEVADRSSTSPHLRHAAATDEGGRGLFLVAQLAQSWGTRYTESGKVIWAECAVEARSTPTGPAERPGRPGRPEATSGRA